MSAVRFIVMYRKSGEIFFYWYALALFLIAVGLGAVLMQKSVGSLLGWSGRISQYLAGFYFLLVVYESGKSAQEMGVPSRKAWRFSLQRRNRITGPCWSP